MWIDLLIATLTTLALETAVMALWYRLPFPGSDFFAAIGVLLSIAAGPVVMWRRAVKPLIPIAAVFCVLMVVALLFISFDIAWTLGRIDL